MSAIGFFTPVYIANPRSFRENLQNFVEGYFDLTSGPSLTTALKIASYATFLIPAVVLAIKVYLHCTGSSQLAPIIVIQNPNTLASFCEKHPEFSALMQKVHNLVHFEDIGFRNGVNSRMFCVGSDTNGQNKIFIKSPMGKYVFARQPRAKNEQLAYLISHRLNLGVVPPTITLVGYSNELDPIFPSSILDHLKTGISPLAPHETSYDGVVVQEGVLLEENQEDFPSSSLDLAQVQNAVIFNLIAGRWDAGRHNTVIVQLGKMMELDNERLGQSLDSESWLLSEFAEMPFSPQIIDNLLSQPINTVRQIFEEMEVFNFDQNTKTNIQGNFDKIREFFTLNRNVQVKVKDLTAFLRTS